ncbi:MAG: acetyl-CoA hydrolase/transferase family protein [Moorellaceae bacterium]
MAKWQEEYKRKLVTAEEAVKCIASGNRVVVAHACGEPQVLIDALVKRAPELENVEIVHMVAMGKSEYCKPEMAGHFRHNSLFVGASTREAVNTGRADYTPCFFSEIPRLFREGYLPVDVALIHVSPPDKHGFCSLGISVDYTKPAAECARIVIAQVNRYMPRTLGDSFMHISQFDYIVEADVPLIEQARAQISEVEERIGRYVAELIEDGSTLQLGIGGIPDAVLLFLKDKKDLGIHTEMFSDGVVELYEAGVITNQRKTIHRGKMVATFLMGSKRLYDFVDDNPVVEMHTVDYTNDPYVIGRHEKMVSINSALQVDLTGQVCADTIGLKQYSGVGGQVDFVRGAARSPGGKSIIAMPSTAGNGRFSRIVPVLDQGAAVTTSRNDVHFVVTEFGIADLRGKTVRQRAKALIEIAHPQFKEELKREVKARGLD